ncbi:MULTISPECIES: hypothetical protein [unclassified Streptomyces]|nr:MULTISPECIES: hypothetical protein [unclassified Streptomyces]
MTRISSLHLLDGQPVYGAARPAGTLRRAVTQTRDANTELGA